MDKTKHILGLSSKIKIILYVSKCLFKKRCLQSRHCGEGIRLQIFYLIFKPLQCMTATAPKLFRYLFSFVDTIHFFSLKLLQQT